MYRYLFGPVPSRRLGMSLGVDLVPMKTCTLNCVYCECGPTIHLTLERKEYVPFDEVKRELRHYLAHHPKPDFITFSGSGEPTLNSGIGKVLAFIKEEAEDLPVALLTNGTLLDQEEVRKEVLGATLVLPSLDTATRRGFQRLNRPHRDLKIDSIVEGLVRFRKEFQGQIWLEVFIVPGINDTEDELAALEDAIKRIGPDRVQLNTLDRPGTVSTLRAATEEELIRIRTLWDYEPIEIIANPKPGNEGVAYREDVNSAILETISRRPCTLQDLSELLGLRASELNKYLRILQAEKKIKPVKGRRGFFYRRVDPEAEASGPEEC